MAQTPATWDDYVGDGVEDTYQVTFPYQKEQEVFAYVDEVLASFTFISAGWIQFDVVPPDQSAIRIIRSTEAFEPRHEFNNGVPLLPRFLDENNTQFLYTVQEAVNETAGTAAEALAVAEEAKDIAQDAKDTVDGAILDTSFQLRADLLNLADPTKNATLVARAGRHYPSITSMVGVEGRYRGDVLQLTSFYGDYAVYDTVNGGGTWLPAYMGGVNVGGSDLVWDETIPRTEHDGGMVISPTVPFDGDPANLADYLDGVGETAPAALGCWVRALADGMVHVTYYGARAMIGFDCTRAFNGATEAFKPYGANPADTIENESPRKRTIGVPSSADPYRLEGTVYIRKGQHLRGSGDGPSRIVIPVAALSTPTFKMAYGLVGGVEVVDDGGLPPSISNLCTEGGHTLGGAVVEATGVAGVSMYKMFITTAPLGFKGAGGDMVLNSCTFDDCTRAVELTGSRNTLSDCHFFHPTANAIRIGAGSYDWLIRDCTFAFCEQQDILVQGDVNTVRGISIVDCNFVENGQYAGKTAHIGLNMGGAEVLIASCNFSNSKSWAIADLGANQNFVRIDGCHFTGRKSNAAYIQSTTARGIRVGGGRWIIQGCDFTEMYDTPISVHGNDTNDRITIEGNTWVGNTYAGALVTVAAMVGSGRVVLANNTGDNVMPLIAAGNFSGVRVGINKRWLGAPVDSGTRLFYKIPTFGVFSGTVKVVANPLPGGSTLYRKGAVFAVTRGTDNISAAIRDYVEFTSLHNPAVGTAGALSVQWDLDAVGSGAQLTPSAVGRSIVVSVPNTYQNFEVEVS